MFEKMLYNISSELCEFGEPDEVLERCIKEKLDNQMNSYANEVDLICNYLLKRDSRKVLRRVALNHKMENKNEE